MIECFELKDPENIDVDKVVKIYNRMNATGVRREHVEELEALGVVAEGTSNFYQSGFGQTDLHGIGNESAKFVIGAIIAAWIAAIISMVSKSNKEIAAIEARTEKIKARTEKIRENSKIMAKAARVSIGDTPDGIELDSYKLSEVFKNEDTSKVSLLNYTPEMLTVAHVKEVDALTDDTLNEITKIVNDASRSFKESHVDEIVKLADSVLPKLDKAISKVTRQKALTIDACNKNMQNFKKNGKILCGSLTLDSCQEDRVEIDKIARKSDTYTVLKATFDSLGSSKGLTEVNKFVRDYAQPLFKLLLNYRSFYIHNVSKSLSAFILSNVAGELKYTTAIGKQMAKDRFTSDEIIAGIREDYAGDKDANPVLRNPPKTSDELAKAMIRYEFVRKYK